MLKTTIDMLKSDCLNSALLQQLWPAWFRIVKLSCFLKWCHISLVKSPCHFQDLHDQ